MPRTASTFLRAPRSQMPEAAAKSLPELECAGGSLKAKVVNFPFRQAAHDNRPTSLWQNAPVPKRERPQGERRANDGTSVQKEAVLSGYPDPRVIVIVLHPLSWYARAIAVRGLSGPAFKGVPPGAPPAA